MGEQENERMAESMDEVVDDLFGVYQKAREDMGVDAATRETERVAFSCGFFAAMAYMRDGLSSMLDELKDSKQAGATGEKEANP